jgi:hypothetical protein
VGVTLDPGSIGQTLVDQVGEFMLAGVAQPSCLCSRESDCGMVCADLGNLGIADSGVTCRLGLVRVLLLRGRLMRQISGEGQGG